MNLNPNAPGTLGLEYAPTVQGTQAVDADSKAVAVRVDSTATESILLVVPYVGTISGGDGPIMTEIYEAGDEVCDAVTTMTFRPNSTIDNEQSDWWKNGWTNRGTYSVNHNYAIDDVVRYNGVKYKAVAVSGPATGPGFKLPSDAAFWTAISLIDMQGPVQESTLDLTDFVTYKGDSHDFADLTYGFDTSAWFSPGLARIIDVRLCFVASTEEDEFILKPIYTAGRSPFPGKYQGVIVSTDPATFAVSFGQMFPAGFHSRPWTDSDIDDLDTGEGFGFRPYNGKSKGLRIYQVWVEVDYVTENRVAYGTLNRGPGPTWPPGGPVPIPVATPAGAAGWPKVDATSYTVLFRRVPLLNDPPLSFTVDYLDSGQPAPQTSYVPTLSGGCVSTIGRPTTRAVPLVLQTLATNSVDSFPYAAFGAAPINSDDGDVKQTITSTAGDTDYRLVRAALRHVAGTDPLEIAVFRSSDDAQMSGTLYITPGELAAYDDLLGTGWKFLDEFLPGLADLAAATDYYVRFRSSAPVGEGYELGYLDVRGVAADRSYGGTTDALYLEAAEDPNLDGLVTFATAPAPPASFSVGVQSQEVGDDGTGCPIGDVEFALILWEPTELGEDFVAYQIQRSDAADLTWRDIAVLTSEPVWQMRDTAARFSTFTRYQMRVLRSDGSRSPWTRVDFVELASPSCGLAITSNVRPDLTVAYQDVGPRQFQLADADETKFSTRYAQGFQTVAYPLEAGSDVIPLRLIVHAESDSGSGDPPADGPGRRVFDPLLRIAGQTIPGEEKVVLPSVCLRNEVGDRWFGTIVVSSVEWDAEHGTYLAECQFTETTDTPEVIDLALTGPLVLYRADGWWDTRTYEGNAFSDPPVPLRDLTGGHDLTFQEGDIGVPMQLVLSRTQMEVGVQAILSPGWDDMWFDMDEAIDLDGNAIDVRIVANLGKLVAFNDANFNIWLHQGSTGDGDFAIAFQYGDVPRRFTILWSEDGTTVQSVPLDFSSPAGTVNIAITFDPATGRAAVYEQPFGSPPSELDLPLSAPAWTLVDEATVGPTSIFASPKPFRHGPRVTDEIDGNPAVGYGHFERITIRRGINEPLVADLDVGRLDLPLGPWEVVGGYPMPPGVTTDEACEAPMYGQVGDVWRVHNFQTGSMPIAVTDRSVIVVGNRCHLTTPVDDAAFDIDAGDDFTLLIAYRWSRAEIDGQTPISHKISDSFGVAAGYSILQTSFAPGGPVALVADGVDAGADNTAATAPDGQVNTAGLVIDRTANTVEAFTNGLGSGSPATLAAVGSPSTPGQPLSIGALLDASLDPQIYAGLEFLGAAFFRRADLTAAEWVAVHDYFADKLADADGYSPFLP